MRTVLSDQNLSYRLTVLFISLILGLVLYAFAVLTWNSPVELGAYDMLMRMRPAPNPGSDIVMLAIDQKTIAARGQLPWSRVQHSRIVRALNRAGAKLIVYDMLLTDPDSAHPGADMTFVSALNSKKNVVLPMAYDPLRSGDWGVSDIRALIGLEKFAVPGRIAYTDGTPSYLYYYFVPPLPVFMNAAKDVGVSAGQTDAAGVVREAPIADLSVVQYPVPAEPLPRDITLPSLVGKTVIFQGLPLVVTRALSDVGNQNLNVDFSRSVSLLTNQYPYADIPINEAGNMLINYTGPAGSIQRYSADELLRGELNASVFAGKTVFVGVTDPASPFTVMLPTPYGWMSRMEINTNSVATVLNRSFITRNTLEALFVLLGLAIILGLLYPTINLLSLGPLSFGIALAYIIIDMLVLTIFHHVWPVIPGILLIILSAVIAGLLKPVLMAELEIAGDYPEPRSRAA